MKTRKTYIRVRVILGLAAGLLGGGCPASSSDLPMDRMDSATANVDASLPEVLPSDVASVDADSNEVLPADTGLPVDTRVVCNMPQYSSDCSLVPTFQCGVEIKCAEGLVTVKWHEHECSGGPGIWSYYCSYACPNGCRAASTGWPASGTALVQSICQP